MNERTKAIGRQAGLVFIEDGVYGQRWYSSKCGLDVSEYEKLVELIVAECEQAIRAEVAITDISGEVEKAWGMGMECGVYTIKKHFGVEE